MLSLITARIVGVATEDTLFFHRLFLDFWSQAKPCLPSFCALHTKLASELSSTFVSTFVCTFALQNSVRANEVSVVNETTSRPNNIKV